MGQGVVRGKERGGGGRLKVELIGKEEATKGIELFFFFLKDEGDSDQHNIG